MTTFTKTINESLNVFGPTPANKWGTVKFGQKWGFGNVDLETNIYQLIENTNTVTISDLISLFLRREVLETLGTSDTFERPTLKDGSGYTYIFNHGDNYVEESGTVTSWNNENNPTTEWE